VKQAQAEIDSYEFAEWLAFAEMEPFGAPFDDLRAGTIASAIYNVNRDFKARPEPFGALDFMPWAQDGETPVDEPIELDDDKAQSDLIRAAIFGVRPE
jgi:hypothetical protein